MISWDPKQRNREKNQHKLEDHPSYSEIIFDLFFHILYHQFVILLVIYLDFYVFHHFINFINVARITIHLQQP